MRVGLGDARHPEPAYYAYAAPIPEGFSEATVHPRSAFWHKDLGEFLLPYDAVRNADDPRAMLLEFLQSAYDAAAGRLSPQATVSTLPAGNTTANTGAEVAVHPAGSFVYGSNRGLDTIAIFSLDAATGQVTLIGNEPTRGQVPRSFAIDDTGTLLVVANQRTAATPNLGNLVVFRIDAGGKLTAIGSPIVGVGSPAFVGLFRF